MEIIKLSNDVITASGGSLADTCLDGCYDSNYFGNQDAADEC